MLLVACFAIPTYAASAVLGIDLGTEYHKAVLVKPGIPLDIVLTKDSKRKEAAALAFKPVSTSSDSSKNIYPERLYGGDALALAARFPGDVYANLKPLMGLTGAQTSTISQFSQRYPGLQVTTCKSGSVCVKSATFTSDEEGFSVEELLAMQLQNIRANAESMAGTKVRDAVITIPVFFTAEEKRALEIAADLAGLRVLSLTTDGLAVGLNYATSRTFPTVNEGGKPEYHLVYDMGAGSTTATIMKFQGRSIKDVGKFNKTIQEILVAGTGWDRTLGGDALNSVVLDDMVTKFADTKQIKDLKVSIQDIRGHGRTIAKMWKEAERMRQVLSANTETQASFEGLYHEDVNFKYKISRKEFEKIVAGFEERVKFPIIQALEMAKLEVNDLNSIILHGGAVRTPFVQKALEALAGKADLLRTNVNSDEAAAFGAAFRGAALSSSFRVKEIGTNETATFPVYLSWKLNGKDRNQKVFVPTSYAGFEKQIPLKTTEEVSFAFTQEITEGIDTKRSIPVLRATTTNLTASVRGLAEEHGCASDNITAAFDVRLSTVNGLPEFSRAYVSCEALDSKKGVVDGVKGLFGFGGKKEGEEVFLDDETLLEPEMKPAESSSISSVASETSSSKVTEKSKAAEKTKKAIKRRFIVNVALSMETLSTAHISGAELVSVKSRMKAFDASDKDRKAREEALNDLEGYTYKIRDLLSEQGFVDASVDTIRAEIKSLSEAASDWLYGDGLSATTAQLKAKYKELADLINPISARKDENTRRPASIASLQTALDSTKNIITTLKDQAEKAAQAAAEAAKSVVSKPAGTTSVPDELDALDDEPAESASETPIDSSQPALISEEDLERITSSYKAVEQWLADKITAQSKLKASDKPALLIREIETKASELQMILIEALSKQMGGSFPKMPKSAKGSRTSKSASKTKTSSTKKGKKTEEAQVKEEL